MKTKIIALIPAIFFLITSCGRYTTPSATATTNAITPTIDASATPLPSPTPTIQPIIRQTKIEVITTNAATGDGGNDWGGHQTRIVHTQDGVFTAYTEGNTHFDRKWNLVQRQSDGTWKIIAKGIAGREPVNLLASPDGTLHIIGWPSGVGTMWSGKPVNGMITLKSESIPNMPSGNWPYSAAGTDTNGDLCILSSIGGETPIGRFQWACFVPSQNKWITQTNKLDYRYAYTYVFPNSNGGLSLVATRDVRWIALGYQQPPGEFGYVFNAFRYWRTSDIVKQPIEPLSFAEEAPTDQYPDVYLDAQMDAYLDTAGRMHILYWQQGATTQGDRQVRHRIVSPSGDIIYDGQLPRTIGDFNRIFQDKKEDYFLLSSSGYLYPMDKDGIKLGQPIPLNLGGYQVEYSGFGLSVPRTGTPLSDVMDVVFPSSNGSAWLYFQLDLSQFSSEANTTLTQTPLASSSASISKPMLKLLTNAQILFDANTNNVALPGWQSPSGDPNIKSQNGHLFFTGIQSNGPQIRSEYGLKVGEACLMLFQYSGNDPDFSFKATAGSWPDTWREWGMNEGTDGSLPGKHMQIFYADSYSALGLRDIANRWYYVMLWIEGNTTFRVAAWEKDNPKAYAEKQLQLTDTENYGNRRWQCDLLVNNGTVEMSSYQELKLTQSP